LFLARYAPQNSTGRPVLLRLHHCRPFQWLFSSSLSVVPSAAGLGETTMPADFIASIFDPAPPLPPEMIAPACPMRRPGGAVTPAMKPTVGFFTRDRFKNSAASSSAPPPISP